MPATKQKTTPGRRFARSPQVAQTGSRFSRSSSTPAQRPPARATRMPRMPRRRQQSTFQKALGGVKGVLPGGGAAKRKAGRRRTGAGAGGLAVLAGVAGLAMKNKDRIMGRLGRGKAQGPPPGSTS